MRTSSGIIAGLFLFGLVANCGGDDGGTAGGGGTMSTTAGQGAGGEGNTGNKGGSTTTAGTLNTAGDTSMGGVAPEGCTADNQCKNGKCVKGECKLNDGQACMADADCQNNCVDMVCSPGLPDGKDCMADSDCAHTCIDNVCAPVSMVGGDCDVASAGGAGGAGGAPSTGGNASIGGAGAGGENAGPPQAHDCVAPLQCVSGKCLTPDGQSCVDNVDCVDTCVNNLCAPKGQPGDACDADDDCVTDVNGMPVSLVCDSKTKTCKLDLLQACSDNKQCSSGRCVCADAACSTRNCKTPDSVCTCHYSTTDSCSVSDTNYLNKGVQDPNNCNTDHLCGTNGACAVNAGGSCTQACKQSDPKNTPNDESDDTCSTQGAPTGCNANYHGQEAADPCTLQKAQLGGSDYFCAATCTCELN